MVAAGEQRAPFSRGHLGRRGRLSRGVRFGEQRHGRFQGRAYFYRLNQGALMRFDFNLILHGF